MKIAVAGGGAFGIKHLEGLANIKGVEVVSLVGRRIEPTQELAAKWKIKHATIDLNEKTVLLVGAGEMAKLAARH